jgi:diguanylate cyclase
MALDPVTLLTLTIALAAAAALYLAIEWNDIRESSLLFWSSGFATIAVGSALALMRSSGWLFLGIWFANGMLIAAHGLFLLGVARFTGTRLGKAWGLLALAWLALLTLPNDGLWSTIMLMANSLLMAVITLRASSLLRTRGAKPNVGALQLRYVLSLHGVFYLIKAVSALLPFSVIDLARFSGTIIQVSLIEGAMAIMLIALSMTGMERHRREARIARLAARDPLTGLYNRRALEDHAPGLLAQVSRDQPGALLLLDIDHFKLVNDSRGHAAGDRLLVALSEIIRAALPEGGLAARLGGDEFLILVPRGSPDHVMALSDRLRGQFRAVVDDAFTTAEPATLSIGAHLFDQPPASLAALIERGDALLYASKRSGRDRIQLTG